MKKLIYVALALILLMVAAGFIIPLFLDPNQYKTEIETKFKGATGYDIDIKGGISVSLFPVAKARIGSVSVSNNSKNLVDIEEIIAYPKLIPLISGNVQVDSVKIVKPQIMLEKNEGGYNWTKIEPAQPAETKTPNVDDTKKKSLALKIDSIAVEDGIIQYNDKVKGKEYVLKEINIESSLGSLEGPLAFDATMKLNDSPLSAKGKVENFAEPKISLTSNLMGTKINYEGALAGGKFSAESADIGPLADVLGIKAAKAYAGLPVNISSDVAYTKEKIDLKNLQLALGDTKGSGSLSATLGDDLNADANMKFQTINLDQLMPKTGQQADSKEARDDENSEEAKGTVSASLNIAADNIIYSGGNFKNLVLNSTINNDEIVLQPMSIDLPGGGRLEVYGVTSKDTRGRVFDGHVNMNAAKLREVLKTLKVNVANMKAGSLESLKLDSELNLSIRDTVKADLSKTVMTLDNTSFNGSIEVDVTKPLSLGITGSIDKIDLNKYIDTSAKPAAANTKKGGPTDDAPLQLTWLEKLPVQGSANLAIGSVTYKDDVYGNVRVNTKFKPDSLEFSEISASSKKLQVAAKGSILTAAGKKPKINVQANIGKIDVADFVKQDPITAAGKASPPKAQGKKRWSEEAINLSILRKLDLDFAANISQLVSKKLVFDNISANGYIEGGKFVLDKSSADFFGGKLSLNGTVGATAVPTVSIGFSGSDVDLYKLLDAMANNQRVQGKITISGTAASSGVSQLAMIQNLTSGVSFATGEVIVKGFDLNGLATQITNTNDITGVIGIARTLSGENAVTYIKTISGGMATEKGVSRTQGEGIKMDAGVGQGVMTGTADLVNWTMDMNALFKLVMPDQKERPGVSIRIFGPIDDPKKDVNLDEIKRYIAERATKLLVKKNILSEKDAQILQPGGLENKLNEELGKGINKLLGGKKAKGAGALPASPVPTPPSPAAGPDE